MNILILAFAISSPSFGVSSPASSKPILELERRTPVAHEFVRVSFDKGIEQVQTSTNLFMPSRYEVGVFQRRSNLLEAQIKTLKKGERTPAARGPIAHGWHLRVYGKPVPDGDPRVARAMAILSRELRSESWSGVETAEVRLRPSDALLTYHTKGKDDRAEKLKLLKDCSSAGEAWLCRSRLGTVRLPFATKKK